MSEKETPPEVVEPEKKKKSKLPMLLAVVAVLGGGGFFAMKMKGGSAKPKVVLGEIFPLEQEFLSNLKEADTYVRAKIALHVQKGYEKTKLVEKMPALEDAIYLILSSKSLSQVRTLDGKVELKAEIAESVNAILEDHPAEAKKTESAPNSAGGAGEAGDRPARKHPNWDSDNGPVLKVYFQSFATQ